MRPPLAPPLDSPASSAFRRVGLLGGTFNPVHVAHLRLALESAERLALDQVVLMPCHTPAHKADAGLLPFDLRLALLRAAVAHTPRLAVTDLEGDLPQPSYTWNSLKEWKRRNPDAHGVFILGSEDFSRLDTWRHGPELPELMDFAVMARAGVNPPGPHTDAMAREQFRHTCQRLWPQSVPMQTSCTKGSTAQNNTAACDDECFLLPTGTVCRFLVMPPLDISASLVRHKWNTIQDIHFLVPDAVLELLQRHQTLVTTCWTTETPLNHL